MLSINHLLFEEVSLDTQSAGKTKRLAKIGLILGIVSFGLLLLTLLLLLWIKFSDYDNFSKLGMFGWAVLLFLGSLILGISGCIIALIALRKYREESNDQKIKRTAIVGLIFSILAVVIALAMIVSAWISASNNSLPDTSTPMPSTPNT